MSSTELMPPVEWYYGAPPAPRYWGNVLLLAATLFSTLLVGARLEYNFVHDLPAFPDIAGFYPMLRDLFPVNWVVTAPSRLWLGVPFCATLMSILLAHEMGHYLCCRHYRVRATLPYFIPAPTLIGTLGAFIRIKSPIRSRAALFDIGIAGPIAGFSLATAILFFGLMLSKPLAPRVEVPFGYPLIFEVMHWLLLHLGIAGRAGIPLEKAYVHPTALAAWVGMFATALNLLPGGQLDGGHIVYAVFPRAHRWISRFTIVGLLAASWWWSGWLVWAMLLRFSGVRHPQVPLAPGLPRGRRKFFLLAILMLALTFMLAPLKGSGFGALLGDLVRGSR
jgi:membrane-associated protease RseP (regulator of RpoE activity)